MVVGVLYVFLFCLFCCGHEAVLKSDSSSSFIRLSKLVDGFPYAHVLKEADINFQKKTGIPMSPAQTYLNYTLLDITNVFHSSMIPKSFVEKGSFHRLLLKLSRKLQNAKNDSDFHTRIPLNILFVGGSVCYGHHTYNESVASTLTSKMLANAHLSWPRRLSSFLIHAFSIISKYLSPKEGVELVLSPRYCCRQATSTTHAVDVMKSEEFKFGRCSHDLLDDNLVGTVDPTWEPDLILWDYSVNDMNSNWFLNRPREYVYENFVKICLEWHGSQIIDFEFINHIFFSPQKKIAFNQRRQINRYYSIPMVDYTVAVGTNFIRDHTPVYAEKLSNRHPAWPTHIIWAQIAFGVLLYGLHEWKEFHIKHVKVSESFGRSAAPYSSFGLNTSSLPMLNSPPESHRNYAVMCGKKKYSSFYDFSDIKNDIDLAQLRSTDGIAPVMVFQF